MKVKNKIAPNEEQINGFLENPEIGPISMVNLLKYKEMAIYDCFQYFNEDHIVDLRLNIVDKYVDYFVISESTKNHQGKDKKINTFI